uniref:Insulin-like peptide 1 n=1 Tax=Grapholita molesta TaxID=192188 RepID=A0A7D7KGE0_GRAMO|nr:insulin-like peptide 1 [Grapholita molesta]
MKIQLSFFAVVVLCVSAYGQSMDTPQTYCGRRLAQTMAALCYHNEDKRSDYNSIRLGFEPEFSWPWVSSRTSDRHHFQDRGLTRDLGVRGKRGIIEECCDHSCSMSTLLSYC